jgi:hypothetical protein
MTAVVYINERSYPLGDASVADVEAVILEAVRVGGSFIDIPLMDGRPARVLVTPASTVHIGEREQPIEASTGDEQYPDFSFFDL